MNEVIAPRKPSQLECYGVRLNTKCPCRQCTTGRGPHAVERDISRTLFGVGRSGLPGVTPQLQLQLNSSLLRRSAFSIPVDTTSSRHHPIVRDGPGLTHVPCASFAPAVAAAPSDASHLPSSIHCLMRSSYIQQVQCTTQYAPSWPPLAPPPPMGHAGASFLPCLRARR